LGKTKIVWSETLLNLTLAQERAIYISQRVTPVMREAAYRRACAKRWYEVVVLSPSVKLDLDDLDPLDAAEVVELRNRVGLTPPWLRKDELAA